MSVIKSKRSESPVEFIYNARNLQIYTAQQVKNFGKTYTFILGQRMADMAFSIHDNVKKANSITPTNAHEVQTRRDLLLNAKSTLHSMISQIEVAEELFGLKAGIKQHWSDLIYDEIRLISGVLKRDKERYKNLISEE